MRNAIILLLIAASVLSLSCASTLGGFKEPTKENTMLVVGHILLEDDYYTDEINTYTKNIEVAVIGKTSAGKELGLWTKTDENGYFAVADVPMGEYALKGIRTIIGRSNAITVTNRLRLSTDPYRVESSEKPITFNAQYYPLEPVGRIQSLQHNLFKLDQMSGQTSQANTNMVFTIKDYKTVTGEVMNAGPVEDYFMEKYPDSAWKPFLENSRETLRFKR
ncbi:hypothetical protein JXQ31_19260 [candidate division KSB1 bacterium]|nr:hypothetical protein [candidate division KSB1 bacterium]